jgi:hypothetical protein
MYGEELDRYVMLPGGHLFIIEFKRPGEWPKGKQARLIKRLKKLGFDVEVHTESEEAIEAVKERLEAQKLSRSGVKVSAKERSRRTVLRSRAR